MYDYGGLYCDTDAFALRKFPEDEWIACSAREEPQWLYPGVLKVPPHQKVLQDCIANVQKKWGNVKVFTDAYQKNFGNINQSHDGYLFYPYTWKNWKKLFDKGDIPTKCYSVHFYTAAINHHSKKLLTYFDENWCKNNPKSLLAKLWIWLQDEEGVINTDEFNRGFNQKNNMMKFSNFFNLFKKNSKSKPKKYGTWWKQKDKKFYDDIYNDTPKLDEPFKKWINTKDNINTILEIGCGDGRYSKILFSSKKYHGIDINENIIKLNILENKNSNHSFKSGDFISDSSLDNNKFDLVFSLSVIDHVYDIDGFITKCINLADKYVWITAYLGYHPDLKSHKTKWKKELSCYHNNLSVSGLEKLLRELNVKFSIEPYPYVDRGKQTTATNIIIDK